MSGRDKTGKVRCIRYKYRRQFMLTAAVSMDYNQNTTAAINHQRTIRIKCLDHSSLFHQLLKKTGRCWEVILGSWGYALVAVAVVERFIKTRVNVWTACRNKKKTGRCWEVAVSRDSTVFCLLHLLLFKLSRCHCEVTGYKSTHKTVP